MPEVVIEKPDLDGVRLRYGFILALAGLGLVLVIALIGAWRFSEPAQVVALVGAAASLVGTLVGAFLGMNMGASGRERAERERDRSQRAALQLALRMDPQKLRQLRKEYPTLFAEG
jgi:hypothetical protein